MPSQIAYSNCSCLLRNSIFSKKFKRRVQSEIVRYTLMRLDEHSRLETVFDPPLCRLQKHSEPQAQTPLCAVQRQGKGRQCFLLPVQRYSPASQPLPVRIAEGAHTPLQPTPLHSWWAQLAGHAISFFEPDNGRQKAGDTITLQTGN